MSGGMWEYRQYEIEEEADRVRAFLRAVARSEHIVDWSECCDTLRKDAEHELYDLWVGVFNKVYGVEE